MIMMTLMTKEVKRSDALLNFGLMYCKTRPSVMDTDPWVKNRLMDRDQKASTTKTQLLEKLGETFYR